MGYWRAGFDVVGVDIVSQPHYPFEFHQADALTYPLSGFDAIHASPPCQFYSSLGSQYDRDRHPDLVAVIRERLIATTVPYVIENVVGAPLQNPVIFCGTSFGLPLKRHRQFESSVLLFGLNCHHDRFKADIPIMNHGWKMTAFVPVYGSSGCKAPDRWNEAMGIDWMTKRELAQAIPPAYTEWIGRQLIRVLERAA